MNAAVLEFLAPIQWPMFALVSARVIGLMLTAPLWSMQAISARIRGAAAVVITLLLMPKVVASPLAMDGGLPILALVAEFLLGVAMGLTAAFFLHGLTVAAEVISLQMGLSLGVALGGMSDVGTPGIGQLYGQTALVIFAALGGHLLLVTGLAQSLEVLPPGSAMDAQRGGTHLLAMAGSVFVTAVRVAAPVMVVLLVTNLALALLNRAVPQLNTMMVAVPITVVVGLVALGATLLLFGGEVSRWVHAVDDGMGALVRSLRPLAAAGGP